MTSLLTLCRVPFDGLRLLVPAIVPSWRFFDAVRASPRLDYALVDGPEDRATAWRGFRPRPAVLTPAAMLRRLLWNPEWNEDLYLVSLAERLVTTDVPATEAHSARELILRVARHLDRHGLCDPGAWLQIRLRFVRRDGDGVVDDIGYLSAPCPIAELVGR